MLLFFFFILVFLWILNLVCCSSCFENKPWKNTYHTKMFLETTRCRMTPSVRQLCKPFQTANSTTNLNVQDRTSARRNKVHMEIEQQVALSWCSAENETYSEQRLAGMNPVTSPNVTYMITHTPLFSYTNSIHSDQSLGKCHFLNILWQTYRKDNVEGDKEVFAAEATSVQCHDDERRLFCFVYLTSL